MLSGRDQATWKDDVSHKGSPYIPVSSSGSRGALIPSAAAAGASVTLPDATVDLGCAKSSRPPCLVTKNRRDQDGPRIEPAGRLSAILLQPRDRRGLLVSTTLCRRATFAASKAPTSAIRRSSRDRAIPCAHGSVPPRGRRWSSPPPSFPELDPGRRMIARLLPTAHLAVHIRRDQTLGNRRA
jgi:hypothetical protein